MNEQDLTRVVISVDFWPIIFYLLIGAIVVVGLTVLDARAGAGFKRRFNSPGDMALQIVVWPFMLFLFICLGLALVFKRVLDIRWQ